MKIVSLTIGLLLIATMVFAETVYTKEEGYQYNILENGDIKAFKITEIFKDGEYRGSKSKPITKNYDKRGVDLSLEISKPEFINAIKEENAITGVGIEETITYQIEVVKSGCMQIRKALKTFEDGEEISKIYYRHVLAPEDDTTNEVERMKDIANVVWTKEVIEKFKEKLEKLKKDKQCLKEGVTVLEYSVDKEGNLTGVVDFWVVDDKGKLDEKGKYAWISNWYINPKYRNNGQIAIFAKKVIDKVPWVEWAYFAREKYNNRLRIYHKRKWLKIIERYNKEGRNVKVMA